MAVQLKDDKVLLVDGNVALDPACCCGCPCPTLTNVTLDLSITGSASGGMTDPECAQTVNVTRSRSWDATATGGVLPGDKFRYTCDPSGTIQFETADPSGFKIDDSLTDGADGSCSRGMGDTLSGTTQAIATISLSNINLSADLQALCDLDPPPTVECGVEEAAISSDIPFDPCVVIGEYTYSETVSGTGIGGATLSYSFTITLTIS